MRLLKSIRNQLGNYQLKSGIYHYSRGESKQAIEYLNRALNGSDSSETDRRMALYYLTETHIAAAEVFEAAHDLERAVQEYRQALKLTPGYADIHFRMGALYTRFDLIPESIEAYGHAVELNPHYLEARVQLAFQLLLAGRKDEALAEFKKSRDLARKAIDSPYAKGLKSFERDDLNEGQEWMREALQRRPESFAFHYRRGLNALRDGGNESAIEHLKEAAGFNPGFADVHNYLGVALGEMEQWTEAIDAFRRALDLNEEYHVARLNLAYALAHAGQTSQAIEELRAVLSREPQNHAALLKLEELSSPRREKARVGGESRD